MTSRTTSYEIFILIISILSYFTIFLLLATPLVTYEHIRQTLMVADVVFCVIFFFDFLWSLYGSANRWKYLRWGWMDLLGSIPLIYPLRVFRMRRVLDATNHLRGMSPGELSKRFRGNPARSTLFFTAVITLVIVFIASTLIVRFEARGPNRLIVSGEEALWWTLVTMTTVGYGDYVPTTTGGRLLAVVLMFLGVGLFGVLTSFLAAAFATPAREARDEEFAAIRIELAEIKQMLREGSELPPDEDDTDLPGSLNRTDREM